MGWGLLKRSAGNFGEQQRIRRARLASRCPPQPPHRSFRGRDKEGQSDSRCGGTCERRQPRPAPCPGGGSAGELRLPGKDPREAGFGLASPLPKSQPRAGAHSTNAEVEGLEHPILLTPSSGNSKEPDFEAFLRTCAAWEAKRSGSITGTWEVWKSINLYSYFYSVRVNSFTKYAMFQEKCCIGLK